MPKQREEKQADRPEVSVNTFAYSTVTMGDFTPGPLKRSSTA